MGSYTLPIYQFHLHISELPLTITNPTLTCIFKFLNTITQNTWMHSFSIQPEVNPLEQIDSNNLLPEYVKPLLLRPTNRNA